MLPESPPNRSQSTASVVVFVVSIFASAFLIFLVQPMVGKRILPWFGGTAAVWMVCLAFYQTALFIGYAYAHLLIRFASPRLQWIIHAILVGVALLLMPVLPGNGWRPEGVSNPVSDIVAMLTANVAVPFLILAATGPLVQAWFARLHPTRSPYPLYAVSNGGSLLALLAYPVILEPRLGLAETGDLWSWAFAVTAALVLLCSALAWRGGSDSSAENPLDANDEAGDRIDAFRIVLWLLLSASAVMVLMGVTNRLCQDVASVPFLWIFPLAVYLITLMLCFASERIFQRGLYIGLGLIALLATVGEPLWMSHAADSPWLAALRLSLPTQIGVYGLLLFCMGMLMHGELYRLRPPPRALTTFYLCVAGGGALGGLFVGLAAPVLFDDYHELALGLALAWALVPLSLLHDRLQNSIASIWRWPGAFLSLAAIALIAVVPSSHPSESDFADIHQERTFFGVLRVSEFSSEEQGGLSLRRLFHGRILHGVQIGGRSFGPRMPTTYYGHATPIGLLLDSRARSEQTRIGVIGLGAGTLAAYGRTDDSFRFYEIDEAIVRLASKGGLFQFLETSDADIETIVGDGRLALSHEENEGLEHRFDILVLDAFSSDAIPVHLLTREAFRIYKKALAPNGIIAAHVTNNHLDLKSQVARQGEDAGFHGLLLSTSPSLKQYSLATEWVFLVPAENSIEALAERLGHARNALALPASALTARISDPQADRRLSVWTDDYSDIFRLLRSAETGSSLDHPLQ